MPGTTADPDEAPRPFLRVVRGDPDPAELAALVTVLATRRGAPRGTTPVPAGWAAYWRRLGGPPPPGPGAWVAMAQAR